MALIEIHGLIVLGVEPELQKRLAAQARCDGRHQQAGRRPTLARETSGLLPSGQCEQPEWLDSGAAAS
jgi:hypothetical protein